MKKTILILFLLFTAAGFIFSAGISLGDFPLGKWLDTKWNAVWEFRSDNIRILDTAGNVLYDFEGKTVENFSVKPSTKGLVLSFSCKEAARSYEFTKPLTNLNLMMVIDRESGTHYEAELPHQK